MAGGLRELKKQRTREAIQDNALRLYREQGYAATTLEQVAAAAEVSLSTLFRYFPTKPDTVLYDRLDPIFVEKFLAQPEELDVLTAMRRTLTETLTTTAEDLARLENTRMQLLAEVPEIRAASVLKIEEGIPMFLEAVARRTGRDPDDPEVEAFVGALAGVVAAAYFRAAVEGGDLVAAADRAMGFLEKGFDL